MSKWRVKKYDGQGVTDLGPVPGRMGMKQIRQHLQGRAVRAMYGLEGNVASTPIDPSMRANLLDQSGNGSLIAHEAGDIVYTAERDKTLLPAKLRHHRKSP